MYCLYYLTDNNVNNAVIRFLIFLCSNEIENLTIQKSVYEKTI
jgi:hypothetical protein